MSHDIEVSTVRTCTLGKVTVLGVLCCFALFVCSTLLASFFLPSHLSLKHVHTGMMETVRIRRSGYPVRREFKDFLFRYGVLGREVGRGMDEKEKSMAILKQHDSEKKDWQLGKTKV